MKLTESLKSVPLAQKSTILAIIKPVLSFIAGVIIAGSSLLGEDSVLTASLVAALPSVCGFSALLGALITAVFTEITAGKVASLATAIVVFLTRLLFDGTTHRRYPGFVSIVATASYLGCVIFAGATAGANPTYFIKIVTVGLILGACTYLTTTVFKSGIKAATMPQLIALFAFAVVIASSYHLGEILSFSVCTICVYKLSREKSTLSAAVQSTSLRLNFLESALRHFPKFANPGSDEHSFENMVELLSLTETDLAKSLTPEKPSPIALRLSEILSNRTGTQVVANPMPDGAVEIYFLKNARISENAILKAAEKSGMGSEVELFCTETDKYIRYTVAPKPSWHFDAGVCQIPANSSEPDDGICGDRAEIWNYGVYSYLILSDGMGTGREAKTTAKSLIKSFRNLTEVGYSLESALRLSSEYIRSCQPDESFATLDILSANLMTGELEIRKCGAAKSYILSGKGVTPIPSGGYPIGILEEISLVNTKISPESDVTILMMTDGADSLGIERIVEISEESEALSTDDLASLLTSEAYKNQKPNYRDDITVAVVKLSKN
ncbi:MAG: serine/threonine-protein phosphatase [Oscillospiraceae bacterium]|nr:serine/threonine-protein phosphatase [Oscillospiraceae bacterium]